MIWLLAKFLIKNNINIFSNVKAATFILVQPSQWRTNCRLWLTPFQFMTLKTVRQNAIYGNECWRLTAASTFWCRHVPINARDWSVSKRANQCIQKPTSQNGCLPCFCPSISLGLERVERTTRGGKMDTVELETGNRGNSLFTLREILSSSIMTSDYRS